MKFSLNVAKCEIVQRGQKTIYEKFNFFLRFIHCETKTECDTRKE